MTRLFESKPFIVAEVGSNWATLSHCIESIQIAKACGADAVKFQLFTAEALYGWDHEQERINAETKTAIGWLQIDPRCFPIRNASLSLEWLPRLKEHADAVGVEFMVSAFSPELVAAVDPFVEVHKVASAEAAWPQLLEAVAKTGKPVLLSTGGKSIDDLKQVYEHLDVAMAGRRRLDSVVWLYCVAGYPTDYADLGQIDVLSKHSHCWSGLSDHTLGYTAAVVAAKNEHCRVIEKHFTAFPDLDTPDRPHSLTPTQFKRMVDIIRGREVESEETAMFLRANRRLIATRDIEHGEALVYGQNYGAYRSLVDDTRGLSPFAWREVEGRCTTKPIKHGTSIGETDFC
jgi:N,N'-diacetyllegionaminate synthase